MVFGIATTLFIVACNKTGVDLINFEVLIKSYDAHTAEKSYLVIRNDKDYMDTLFAAGRLKGSSDSVEDYQMIPVNFSRYYLIAVFQGQKNTGGYGIAVKKIIDEGDKLKVYVEEMSPGAGCPVTMAFTSPYSIVKIQKTGKEIIFKTDKIVTQCKNAG